MPFYQAGMGGKRDVIDWKGMSDVMNERARIAEAARANQANEAAKTRSLDIQQQGQQQTLAIDVMKEGNRKGEADRAFADSHALLGEQLAAAKTTNRLNQINLAAAELAKTQGVAEAEVASKVSQANQVTRRAKELVDTRSSLNSWDANENTKLLRTAEKDALASASGQNFFGAIKAMDDHEKLFDSTATWAHQNIAQLSAAGEVGLPAMPTPSEMLKKKIGELVPPIDTGMKEQVVVATQYDKNNLTADELTNMKLTPDKKQTTEKPIMWTLPQLRQEIQNPSKSGNQQKAIELLFNSTPVSQRKDLAEYLKTTIKPENFDKLNIPGLTYDPMTPIDVKIGDKTEKMPMADYAVKQLRESILTPASSPSSVKVDLSESKTSDPIKGKPVVFNTDGTPKVIDLQHGIKMYASDSKALDAGRTFRYLAGEALTPAGNVLKGLVSGAGSVISGLFGSDGAPDVYAQVGERKYTQADLEFLSRSDESLKDIELAVRRNPRDKALIEKSKAAYRVAHDWSVKVRQFGVAKVMADEKDRVAKLGIMK